jgi:hypothetical protein
MGDEKFPSTETFPDPEGALFPYHLLPHAVLVLHLTIPGEERLAMGIKMAVAALALVSLSWAEIITYGAAAT